MQHTSLLTNPDQLAKVLAGKTDEAELTGIRIAHNAGQIVSAWIPLRYGYQVLGVFVLVSAVFIIFAGFDGVLTTTAFTDIRGAFLAPVLLIYLMFVEPALRILRDKAASSMVVKIPEYESQLGRILDEIPGCSRTGQVVGFLTGFAISVLIFNPWSSNSDITMSQLYVGVFMSVMFGYMSWLVYTWIVAIKMFGKLQNEAADYEPLKCEDLYPVGRWAIAIGTSLLLASALSMMFLTREALFSSTSGIVYTILVLTAFGITFAAAWSTHRMMDKEKKSALKQAVNRISRLAAALGRAPSQIDAEQLRAWIALESRIESTSSWPFNTAMLRRMFLAISIPGAAAGARILPNLLSN